VVERKSEELRVSGSIPFSRTNSDLSYNGQYYRPVKAGERVRFPSSPPLITGLRLKDKDGGPSPHRLGFDALRPDQFTSVPRRDQRLINSSAADCC
jgi:hypothetical protein